MTAKTTMRLLAGLALVSALAAGGQPDQRDPELQRRLEDLLRPFGGTAGVYVRHLRSGKLAAIRANEVFPAASMVKVPILLGLFDLIQRGELGYHKVLVYRVAERDPSEGVLSSFKDGETIDPALLVNFMLSFSDNLASLWCQELAGGGTAINLWLAGQGFEQTRVNSRTPGREVDREAYGWGQTTPREMAELLVRIHQGRAISPTADEEMLRALSRNYWDGVGLGQFPPTVHAISKGGAVEASRSEAVLVDAPSGPYVFCLITKNQTDRAWGKDNEGQVLIRSVSRLLWTYFEPGSSWTPAPKESRFR